MYFRRLLLEIVFRHYNRNIPYPSWYNERVKSNGYNYQGPLSSDLDIHE
jgi:hypothetical protein